MAGIAAAHVGAHIGGNRARSRQVASSDRPVCRRQQLQRQRHSAVGDGGMEVEANSSARAPPAPAIRHHSGSAWLPEGASEMGRAHVPILRCNSYGTSAIRPEEVRPSVAAKDALP
jgi:hypothetical protein